MAPNIRLIHGCNRMHAHRWMPIEAINLSVNPGTCEQISEKTIPTKRWSANYNGYGSPVKIIACDVHDPPDAPGCRRAIEGGASLIVDKRSPKLLKGREDRWQLLVHLRRSHRSAITGDAYRFQSREAGEVLYSRRL